MDKKTAVKTPNKCEESDQSIEISEESETTQPGNGVFLPEKLIDTSRKADKDPAAFKEFDCDKLWEQKMDGRFAQSYRKSSWCSKLFFRYGNPLITSVRKNNNAMTE